MVKDPVCDMDVEEHRATEKSEYRGKPYCFCSALCKTWFDKEPERYLIPALSELKRPKLAKLRTKRAE